MRWRTLRSWAHGLFRRDRVEHEMAEEIRSHLDARVADLVRAGAAVEDAERRARIEFGSIERFKEEVRTARGLGRVDTLTADLRYGARGMRRAPGFACVSVLSLALGIGANTLVFSVLDAALLRPPGLPEPDRLVVLWNVPDDTRPDQLGTNSISRFYAMRDLSRSFESVAAFNGAACGVRTLGFEESGRPPERIFGQTVSPSFFRTLGVQPLIGRTFTEAEDVVDQVAPVVVISHRMWERRFAKDPGVLGRLMMLDRAPTTVIGVMPEDFDFFDESVEFLAPLCLTRAQVESRVGGNMVVGRLKPGVSSGEAQRELDVLAAQLARDDPARHRGIGTRVESLQRAQARLLNVNGQPSGDYGGTLIVLQGAVAFVLLIACANVAGLLMARQASRQDEVALRMALGAHRGRIVRQLITETLPLALLGAAAGTALAWAGLKLFIAAAPGDFPRLAEISMNVRVLGTTALVALLTNVLFGLAPALQGTRVARGRAMRDSGRGATDGLRRQRLRGVLVAGQIALALVLLTGAGLMIRSFVNALENDLGVDPTGVLTFDFRLPARESFKQVGMYRGSGLFEVSPQPAEIVDRVRDRLQRLPGVAAVAAASVAPFSPTMTMPFSIEGGDQTAAGATREGSRPQTGYLAITPDFFAAMRIPLRRGRDFQTTDTAQSPFVVIVSESFARQYLPGEDPVGKYLRFDFIPDEPLRQIVGVVGDTVGGRLQAARTPTVYAPHVQQTSRFVGPFVYTRIGMVFVLRTEGEPRRLLPSVQRAAAEVDPAIPVANPATIEQALDEQVRYLQLYMGLLGAFGAVAALLAAIGIYGVVAYTVSRRTREFGIRMAMGARAGDLLTMVLGYSLRVIGIGLLAGLASAFAASQALRSMLFGVTTTDPATYAAVAALLLLIAIAACVVPARRAAIIDPTAALRQE